MGCFNSGDTVFIDGNDQILIAIKGPGEIFWIDNIFGRIFIEMDSFKYPPLNNRLVGDVQDRATCDNQNNEG